MRNKKVKAAKVLAAGMAFATAFTSIPFTGLGMVTVYAEEQNYGVNLLTNGDFANGAERWGANSNAAAFSYDNGKVTLTAPMDNVLGQDWMPGVFQEGFNFEDGKEYQIEFDIVSSIDRKMTVGIDTGRYCMEDVTLVADEPQHVSYRTGVINGYRGNQKLYFYLGMFHNEENYNAHTVEIDNVSVREVVSGETVVPGGNDNQGESGSQGGNNQGGNNQGGNEVVVPNPPVVSGPTLDDEFYPENLVNGVGYNANRTMTKETVDFNNVVSKWSLQWSDEFGTEEFNGGKLVAHNVNGSGSDLESAAWTYMIGNGTGYSGSGWGNNELEYYTDTNTRVVVGEDIDGGALVIDAKKEDYKGGKFTSARLWTMDDGNLTKNKEALYTKEYGRFESRIKIETKEGEDPTGLWPAFWMMPAYDVYGTWAASGELDIMETRGSNVGLVDGTIHFGSQWPNNKAIGGHYGATNDALCDRDDEFSTADWHTYAVEWMPGEIRWYVDDECYYATGEWYATSGNNATNYAYPAPFNQEFYILLNLAVGGNYDAGKLSENLTGASMYVDYVRVYDYVDENDKVFNKDDYEAVEMTVKAPTHDTVDKPVVGEVGSDYVNVGHLLNYRVTGNYPSENDTVRNAQWFVSNLSSGTGKSTNSLLKDGEDDVLCIDVTNVGANDYEVQLIHNVPLTRGYRYVLEFDAKADTSKGISAKFANIAGYPSYSDGMNIGLESEWQHYKFVMDMNADTDADGRIEFTMGGSTGKSYYKNFSIVCTGVIPELDADDDKEKLANGNHVYNGNFDEGAGNTFFWHTYENTTLVSNKNEFVGIVSGSASNSGIYEKGMNLLATDKYRVSFDAKAVNDGTITVKLLSADQSTVYAENTVNVNGTNERKTFEFTMPDVTDTGAVIAFVIGENTVCIDNITMLRLTNNNLDWSKVNLYPLYNGDFYNGDDGWNIWSENAGWQTHSVNGNGYMDMEYNVGAGADFWCVGVQSAPMKLIAGVPYKINITYESTIDKNIKVETPDGVQVDYDFAKGFHTKTIEFVPTKDVSGNLGLYFGNQPTGGNQHFIIASVDVRVNREDVPERFFIEKAASIASKKAVHIGESPVIRVSDATWATKITTVYVNNVPYDNSYVTANGNEVVLSAELFPEEGAYEVKFEAEGYTVTGTIAQKILGENNAITNGGFASTLEAWETFFSSWNYVTGTAASENGMAHVTILGTESNNWDAQLKQAGLELEGGEYYLLSFDAYASVARPIQMEFGSLGTASNTIVNLSTEKETHYIYFKNVPKTTSASVLFMMGNVNGIMNSFDNIGIHDIYIDNVKLHESSLEEIYSKIAPKVSLSELPAIGEDIVAVYEENPVWENKEITVMVDGIAMPSEFVTVDKNANKITVNGAAVASVGTYTLEFAVSGYSAVALDVNVLKDHKASILPEAWTTWIDKDRNEAGTLATTENSIDFDFVETVVSEWNGPEFWSVQVIKENIGVVAGKTYVLSFDTELNYTDSSVTADRGVVIETQLGQKTIQVAPGKNHVDIEYVPNATSFKVQIMLGGAELDVAAHHITLSNITLYEKSNNATVSKEKMEALETVNVTTTAAADCDGTVTLSWEATEEAMTYGVYVAASENDNYVLIAVTDETTYTVSDLDAGNYYYAVAVLPSGDEYTASDIVKVAAKVEANVPVVTPGEDDEDDNKGEGNEGGNTTGGNTGNNTGDNTTGNNGGNNTSGDNTTGNAGGNNAGGNNTGNTTSNNNDNNVSGNNNSDNNNNADTNIGNDNNGDKVSEVEADETPSGDNSQPDRRAEVEADETKTGDPSKLALMLEILAISGMTLFGGIVMNRRRKEEE